MHVYYQTEWEQHTMAATAAEPDPPPGEGVRLPKDLIKSHNGMEANGPFLFVPITYLCNKR